MFEKAPDVWGWFSLSVTRVKSNSYLYWGSFTAFPGGTVVRALRQTWLVLLVVWWATGDHHHPEYSGGNEKDRVTRRVDARSWADTPSFLAGGERH